jgi:hypothetical protein
LAFIKANPNASGPAIDEAATNYTPFNPGRRHFQDACYGFQFIHPWHWSMDLGNGRAKGGIAQSWKGALESISRANHMAQAMGQKVRNWRIYNRDDVCVADMTNF